MYLLTLDGKMHLTPFRQPQVFLHCMKPSARLLTGQNLLDVSTGMGIWAMYVKHDQYSLQVETNIVTSKMTWPMNSLAPG